MSDREPGAEHPLPAVIPEPVNPDVLADVAHSDPAGFAAYLRHLSARALGRQLETHREDASADTERRR